MGEAIASALLSNGVCEPTDIWVSDVVEYAPCLSERQVRCEGHALKYGGSRRG